MERFILKNLTLSALAINLNIILGSVTTMFHIPFLYLDSIGTISVAATLGLQYGLLTSFCTNLVLALIYGPLALPFGLVDMTIALVTYLFPKFRTLKMRIFIQQDLFTIIK